MKILFVNTIQMFGGGEVWMLRTLKGLKSRGHDVALMCRPNVKVGEKAEALDIPVHRIRVRGDFDPVTIIKTYRILKKNKYNVVLCNMDKELRFAGIAAKLAGDCVVIPRRGIDYPLKDKLHYRYTYNVLADAVIANSNATKDSLLKYAKWLDPNRVRVIHNGIDPLPYMTEPSDTVRSELGIERDEKIVGFAGQLDERKGLEFLLPAFFDALKIYPNAHLVLAGIGPMDGWITEFAQKYKLEDKIHLIGFQEDITAFMQGIDVFVLPSLWEGFGIVLIEAMAAGKPCVTTNISSMPEIVLNEITGIVVPPKNAKELGAALGNLLADQELADKMGLAGQKRVQDFFSIEKMLGSLESLFTELLHKRKRRETVE